MSAKPLRVCPEDLCAQKKWGRGKVKKKISAGAGLLFKGSGFYITDYRSEKYKTAAKKDSAPAKPGRRRSQARPGETRRQSGQKMKPPSNRCIVESCKRCNGSAIQRFTFCRRCFLARCFSRRRPRAIFHCRTSSSTRSISGQFIVSGAGANFAAGRFATCRRRHQFCPARTRAAGGFRRTHQGFALAPTWKSTANAHRGAGRFFSWCIRRSRWTRTSPSFPRVRRRLGVIAWSCPMFCHARPLRAGADRRVAAGIRQPQRAVPFRGNSRVAGRRPGAANAGSRLAGNHFVGAGQTW